MVLGRSPGPPALGATPPPPAEEPRQPGAGWMLADAEAESGYRAAVPSRVSTRAGWAASQASIAGSLDRT